MKTMLRFCLMTLVLLQAGCKSCIPNCDPSPITTLLHLETDNTSACQYTYTNGQLFEIQIDAKEFPQQVIKFESSPNTAYPISITVPKCDFYTITLRIRDSLVKVECCQNICPSGGAYKPVWVEARDNLGNPALFNNNSNDPPFQPTVKVKLETCQC